MSDPKSLPDIDPDVLGEVTEDPEDVVEDDSIVLPAQSVAPDLYFPPAP